MASAGTASACRPRTQPPPPFNPEKVQADGPALALFGAPAPQPLIEGFEQRFVARDLIERLGAGVSKPRVLFHVLDDRQGALFPTRRGPETAEAPPHPGDRD